MNIGRVALVFLSLLIGFGDLSRTQAATLSVTAEHGSVILRPPGGSYTVGTEVYMISRPDTGYSFDHWSGDISGNCLVYKITMDADKSVTAHFKAWEAPLGIPAPAFGIFETYRMYDTPSNRNAALIYQASTEGGYFTHYVDNTDPAATDTTNPNGSIAKPRQTIPRGLPAGSVVEVHGGPYSLDPKINGTGTEAQPIFIRGPSTGTQPQITARTTIGYYTSQDATYLILENMRLYGVGVKAMNNTHHIAVRGCDIEGKVTDFHMSGVSVSANSSSAADASVSYAVIYNNTIHHFGDYEATGDPDAHGLSVTSGNTLSPLTTRSSSYVWILDNLFYRNSGNGVQINAGNLAFQQDVHHIYLGRNLGYQNKQDALWTKNATDVIFSQNCIWDHTPSDSSLGGGLGSQYGPERVWFLFNEVSECSYGIRQSTDQGGGGEGPGTDNYMIGNLLRDIHRPAGQAGGTDVWKKGAAIFIASERARKNIFGNTICNTDAGIQIARRAELHVNGNIFTQVAEQHIFFEFPDSLGEGESDLAYNLFDNPARILWGRTADSTTYSLTRFRSAYPGKSDGSLEADPLFVAPDNHNFRLRSTSPAIDVGIPAAVQQAYDRFNQLYGLDIRKDITGRARAQGNDWDLGAYEYVLAAVTNLAVSGISQNSLTLTWTVPGEQGITGVPSRYDIRYFSSPLTEASWAAATQVQGEPSAGGLGQSQSFTVTGLTPGATYYVAVKVLDEAGHASVLSNVVSGTTTTSGNHAPVFTPIGDQSVIETETLTFSISATDADGDPLTYSPPPDLPTGASFTAATQTFTWTPTALQRGQHRVTFQVNDTHVTVSETITITVRAGVDQPPAFAAIGDQSTNENTSLSFSLSATDPDGDPLTFSATGLPSGASLVNGVFSWTPGYGQAGSYPVTFTVSDGQLTDSEQITITVAGVSDRTAPTAQAVYPAADAIQVPVNPVIALTVSDSGSGVDASTVAIRVNDQPVYSGDSSLYESVYGTCRRSGTPASYSYYFSPAQALDFDQEATVQVSASDAAHNAMTPVSYQFVTEMRSFGRNQAVSASGESSGHPAVARDSQGNFWAVWHAGPAEARDVYVAKHGSTLQQWDAPVRLTNLASDQCNPALAVGPDDKLYVAWQDNHRGNWDVYVSSSSDGSTWGDPVRVTDSNDNQMNPVIAVDQASPYHVYIAWERGNAGSRDIYLASSNASFTNKTIAQVTSDPADQLEPAVAVATDNTVYLAWTDQRNGTADIYGSSSAVSSWTNTLLVTGPGNQSHPAVAVEPGTTMLHLLWADDTAGNLDVIYGSSNGLPGSPIAGTTMVDDTTHADQSAPKIVVAQDHWNNTHVYACWQDNRVVGSASDTDLYFAEIRSGAAGTNVLVGDDGTNSGQSEPALGCDQYGQPAVVWTDGRSGTPRIYNAYSVYMAPVAVASALITRAAGGRVGVDPAAINDVGDVSIQIPPAACDYDVAISISAIQNLPRFTSVGIAGYEIGPSGLQFAVPATVTIPYASSGVALRTPYWYDTQTGILSQQGMTDITYRTLANGIPVVSFKTTHLTPFYILESPVATGGTGGGGGGCALVNARGGNAVEFLLPFAVVVPFLFILKQRDRRQREASRNTLSR